MNEEEVIERLNSFKTIKVLYGNTFSMHLEQLEQLQNDIEIVLSELEKKDKIIDLIVEDFQNDGYLKGMSREEILDYYQERLWLKKQRNPLPLKLDIVG